MQLLIFHHYNRISVAITPHFNVSPLVYRVEDGFEQIDDGEIWNAFRSRPFSDRARHLAPEIMAAIEPRADSLRVV